MTSKGNVIHKQQFQNAQQVIEVTVKSKPRAKLGLKTKSKPSSNPFVRDCLLKKELERLTKEIEDKRLKIKANKMNPERPMPHLKINQPKTVIEIHKKSKRKKKDKKDHEILPPGVTWGDFLKNISSSKSSDSQLSNIQSVDTSTSREEAVRKMKDCSNGHRNYENENHILESYRADFLGSKVQRSHPRFRNKRINEHRIYEKVTDQKNEKNINKPCERREAPMILPTNSCKPLQINRSIQTSVISGLEDALPDQPDFKKSVPPALPIKTQADQTHSPFGESALRLLQHLRERLHSKGDSEGSEIVNALEAYFGSAERRPNNGDLEMGDSASPVFPPVFSQKEALPPPSNDFEKQRLTRIIGKQDKKIQEQDEAIHELKSLSARLLAYHEQLTKQTIQSIKNIPNNLNPGDNKEKKGEDSGVDLSASEDLQRALKHMTSERDALLKEVKNQREIILNLEVKLSQFEKGYDMRSEKRNYGVHRSRLVGPLDKDAKLTGDKYAQLLCHAPPNDSDADSAYEDKSYKSSRPTSKASSSVNNRSSFPGKESKISTKKISSSAPVQNDQLLVPTNVVNRPVLSELGVYANNNVNRGNESITSSHERCPRVEVILSSLPEHNSIYPVGVSDTSSDHSTAFITYEDTNFEPRSYQNVKRTLLSETPVYTTPDNYFESTHVDKRKPYTSSTKPAVSRRGFEPPLSYLDLGASGDETKLMPVIIESE